MQGVFAPKGIAFFEITSIISIVQRTEHILKERRNATMLFAPKEKGQGLVEYALILVLVAVVVIAILALLGPAIGNVFSTIFNQI
jgi:pilus assembly protein Flp/PilA